MPPECLLDRGGGAIAVITGICTARPWSISNQPLRHDTIWYSRITGKGGARQKPFGRCPNRQGTFYEGASLNMHMSFMHRYFFLAKDNVLVYYVLYYKKLLLTFVIASKSSLYKTQNSCVVKHKFWRVQIVCWLLVSFSPLSSLQSRKRWGSGVN